MEKAVEILENKILSRLFDVSEYGIADYRWLSYPSMISIWLGLFLKAEKGEIDIDIAKINKWYWSVIFTERYSGSTETKQTKDFKDLVAWLTDSNKLPEATVDMRSKLNIMKMETKYPGSSIYKGIFNLLFRRGAWDFYEKDKIKFSVKDLEDHHIFPRKFLESKNVKVEKDIVLNRTLILSSTNKKISRKAPASHFDGCFKLIQSILPTRPHKEEGRENKTFSFSYCGLMIMKPTSTRPEKEKFLKKNLTFCFSLLYIIM